MSREFTKIKNGSIPKVNITTNSDNPNVYTVHIGRNSDDFDKNDLSQLLIDMGCVDENSYVRYDLLASKILYFVNELVKLTEKPK